MNTSTLRQQLHRYIDEVDDKKIEAIFTILQPDIDRASYTNEELQMFYERRNKYLSGGTTTYSAEEAHNYIRQNRKKS